MRACSRLLFFRRRARRGPGHFDEFARHHDIHAIMEVNPEYQKELAAAKAELRQALELDAQAAK